MRADFPDQELGLNPVGVAEGVEDTGDEPIFAELAIVERIRARAKNAHTPAERAGMEGERVGLKQTEESVVFGEDGLGFRAGALQVVGQYA